ncbi:hypothetical protein HK100_001319 [Physocladia obscura]|uniref:Ran guanine nucleotide release factor n=1 Tax=Physocladia obscura TaxID=109957 RepID=A0AAD5SY00_9FUNG|nr:hypothetical protein HK100_001319 [Physocladia obscura]
MTTQLFGGAITLSIPVSFIDASTLRQVPDNQEVYVDTASSASLIIEILESVTDTEDYTKFHYAQLAEDNEAIIDEKQPLRTSVRLDLQSNRNLKLETHIVGGIQYAAKFNTVVKDQISVFLAVVRVPAPYSADILISLNAPFGETDATLMNAVWSVENNPALAAFYRIVSSFCINDYSLFAQ